jgi:hypothetical protein
MNKTTVLKYFTEFKAWCEDKEVYVMFNNGGHRLVDSIEDFNETVKYIILKDSYFTYRKALAEGKTIQFQGYAPKYTKWVDTDTIDTSFEPGEYRIKPDEPQFEVGDWIMNSYTKTIKQYSYNDLAYDNKYDGTDMESKHWSLWQPQPGEYVWVKPAYKLPFFAKFISTTSEGRYEYTDGDDYYTSDNCEPFIGTLPTFIKEP